jgi:hypothetical protein
VPRSHGVIKVSVWEVGSGFRALSLDAQWAYEMLISQPQINNCGLLPYTPEKWVRFAAGLDKFRLGEALLELEIKRFTITDADTGEILVRTFIKHDQIWKQPKLVTNARKLIREVESERIREYLLSRHPWLTDETWLLKKIEQHETSKKVATQDAQEAHDTPSVRGSVRGSDTPSHTPIAEPVENGSQKGVSEGVTEGVSPPRASARDDLPLPLDQDPPLGLGLSRSEAVALDVAADERDRTAREQLLAEITPDLREIE